MEMKRLGVVAELIHTQIERLAAPRRFTTILHATFLYTVRGSEHIHVPDVGRGGSLGEVDDTLTVRCLTVILACFCNRHHGIPKLRTFGSKRSHLRGARKSSHTADPPNRQPHVKIALSPRSITIRGVSDYAIFRHLMKGVLAARELRTG